MTSDHDDQSMPFPEMPDVFVKAPSADPRWEQPQIMQWRKDSALVRQNVLPVVLETNGSSLIGYLKTLGFDVLTEDLIYVFWVGLPVFFHFASSRIAAVCHHPVVCGASACNHMEDGLSFAGAHLLYLEDNYLGKVIL